jgi:hydrogenase-4 component H
VKLPCLLQLRVLKLAVTSLFSKPFTDPFPSPDYKPSERYRGIPRYHEDDCIGCGACAEVCPAICIDMTDDAESDPPMRRFVHHLDACIQCGQCERYCTTEKGIQLGNEYICVGFKPEDFEEKVDKELLRCEACGCLLAPVDQIRWLARRLGPLAFTNPTVMLVSHRDLAVVDEGVKSEADDVQRAQRVSIQCPKCRRKTALAV